MCEFFPICSEMQTGKNLLSFIVPQIREILLLFMPMSGGGMEIFMLYQKEIDDSVLIQFIILFTLSNADKPLAYNQLINLVMDNCNINYNDFQIALDNLSVTKHIRSYIESGHNQLFEITQKGLDIENFFRTQVPIYIREPITESIKQLFIDERRKNSIQSKITQVDPNEYTADCRLLDDDKTVLMELSLFAGARDEAERIAVYFKEHSGEIYEKILKAFNE